MRKYIIKRILISIVILFFVAFIIYALMRCLPTSYIENMARQKSMQPGSKSFDEWMEQLTAMYNMDKGIVYGFFAWMVTSSAVVGSSAMMMRGLQASAMAIMTRWRMPPESSWGNIW